MYWAVTPYLGHPPVFGSNFAMRREVWAELGGEVHRETGIHDDLDLSLHVKPWMQVDYDPDLMVRDLGAAVRHLGGADPPAVLGDPDAAQPLAGGCAVAPSCRAPRVARGARGTAPRTPELSAA